MKKLLFLFALSLVIRCSDSRSRDREAGAKTEDYQEEDRGLDEASGKEISPQLQLDSTESRFKIDTISSSTGAENQRKDDSIE
ncbi:MAG TPA: hypothetical protein VF490_17805 [Chryseosolibacter sp.]